MAFLYAFSFSRKKLLPFQGPLLLHECRARPARTLPDPALCVVSACGPGKGNKFLNKDVQSVELIKKEVRFCRRCLSAPSPLHRAGSHTIARLAGVLGPFRAEHHARCKAATLQASSRDPGDGPAARQGDQGLCLALFSSFSPMVANAGSHTRRHSTSLDV